MNEAEVGAVRLEAGLFRRALELLDDPLLPCLQSFPKNACGDSSRLLAQRFRDVGLGEWSIITGWRDGRNRSHAWLERDGWIVDITANQFVAEVEEPVLMLRESGWHRTWNDHQASSFGVGVSHYSEESGARVDYARLCALVDGFSRPA